MDLINYIDYLEHNLKIGDIVQIVSTTGDRAPAIGHLYKVVKTKDKHSQGCFNRVFCDKVDKNKCILLRSVDNNFPLWTCYCTCKLIEKSDSTEIKREEEDIEWMG